ncbi:hypothetical protein TD95_000052 [Thielaviopsis punctulata]|uniref:Uncharacterized protein n=1 Tax=Thielaviopsis punctulata TaxID=72032 RepID=A0A0F4Z801_9PEZI|nr:hypothetical protein TD95_000052 [Thielaviopsis punctulata]
MYALQNAVTYKVADPRADDVYVLDVQRLQSALVSITSDQKLSVYAPEHLASGPVFSTTTNHGNLTKFSILDGASSLVASTGEDGTVAVWDLRNEATKAQVAHFKAADGAILSMACDLRTHSIAVGTELQEKARYAAIALWDIRSTPSKTRQYVEVHSDDITELKFHPNDGNLLLSGSTDGLVNVCDTRITDEDEVIIQTFNHGASIHHADFLSTTEVYALSHDERFALYDMADHVEKGSAMLDVGDLRKPLGCQYVANVTTKTDGSGAIIGAGCQDQQGFTLIHLAKNNGSWGLAPESAVTLPGAHGEELIRGFCFFDESHAIFTGGEDGTIKGWVPPS